MSAAPPVGPPPPFDAELAGALAAVGDPIRATSSPDPVGLMRQATAGIPSPDDEQLARGGTFRVEHHTVERTPALDLLVCLPVAPDPPSGVLHHLHGGGLISGDARAGIDQALDIAEQLALAVVSVEYRLAPETPHPGPVEDCYAGLFWSAEHADELRVDPKRIVLVGASAGGCLAAATALLARHRGGPTLAGQLLLSPMLDDRADSPASVQTAGTGTWDRGWSQVAWRALLGSDAGGAGTSPFAAPARATDLSGLPPTFVDVGSAEPFRDEAVDYAARIWRAGGSAELHVWPGAFHGFDVFAPGARLSLAARAARTDWTRRLLTGAPPAPAH